MKKGEFSKGEKRVASLLSTGSACLAYIVIFFYILWNTLGKQKRMVYIGLGMMIVLSILQFVFVVSRLDIDALVCAAFVVALSAIPWIYFINNRHPHLHWINLMVMQAGLVSVMSLISLSAVIWLYSGGVKKHVKKQK